jgi:hypothetical protein
MPAPQPDCDSLTADLVIADDQGGTTLLPADPEALARFLAECRALERRSTAPPNERKP